MTTHNHNSNKLFLVCPYCQMENFIVRHFDEVFFLTAPASVFDFKQEYFEMLKVLIDQEKITEVYLVGETTCNFVNNIIQDKDLSGLEFKTEIKNLMERDDTPHSLTQKLLNHQMEKLTSDLLFGKEAAEGKILFYTLLTNKRINQIIKSN